MKLKFFRKKFIMDNLEENKWYRNTRSGAYDTYTKFTPYKNGWYKAEVLSYAINDGYANISESYRSKHEIKYWVNNHGPMEVTCHSVLTIINKDYSLYKPMKRA